MTTEDKKYTITYPKFNSQVMFKGIVYECKDCKEVTNIV